MIYRPRNLRAMPPSLDAAAPAKVAEATLAKAHYAKIPLPKKNHEFSVYSSADVKATLNDLFGFKCAYCEGVTGGVMPIDIEHYRPKGEIVAADLTVVRPGYWWLAAEWDNLLPSCIDCNRRRWHKISATDQLKYGKENLFPLAVGSVHAKLPGEIAAELPLLINPANEDPAVHLTFVPEVDAAAAAAGGAAAAGPFAREWVASPQSLDNGDEDPRGRQSIEIYGLNKPEVVKQRNDRLKELANLLRSAEERWWDAQGETDPVRRAKAMARVRADFRQAIDTHLHWKRRYAGACRALFKAWREAFIAQAKAAGLDVAL